MAEWNSEINKKNFFVFRRKYSQTHYGSLSEPKQIFVACASQTSEGARQIQAKAQTEVEESRQTKTLNKQRQRFAKCWRLPT